MNTKYELWLVLEYHAEYKMYHCTLHTQSGPQSWWFFQGSSMTTNFLSLKKDIHSLIIGPHEIFL